MRLFTAIDIPQKIQLQLSGVIARLRPSAKISWTRIEKLHITTKFIGEWPEDRLDEMKAALESVGSPGVFEITIGGLGWFPNARNPHTLWAGVEAPEELKTLAHSTEAALEALGVPAEERKFSPHLTLARVRNHADVNALRAAVAAMGSPQFGGFSPVAFCLYLSQDEKYTKMAEFPLI